MLKSLGGGGGVGGGSVNQITSTDGSVGVTSATGPTVNLSAARFGSTILVLPSGDASGATDTAAINAATTALGAAGGAIQYKAAKYFINAPLVCASGVYHQGAGPVLDYTSSSVPDSSPTKIGNGTWFQAVGTTACFQVNKTALGVAASQNAFTILGITNFAISQIGFSGFTRALDGGNTNNPSFWYSCFSDLYFAACTDWSMFVTNFQHCDFRRLRSFNATTGQFYFGNDVPSATLQPGNSIWEDIYAVTSTNLQRGIVFEVTQGQQNQAHMYRIQSNRVNASTQTQAATMANAAQNITITSGAQFLLKMPVTVSATANGFAQNQIYFVVSVAGNVIQLSDTVGGTAITATGATAVNVITQGMAALELVALAGAASSSHVLHDVDVESGGTASIVVQNASLMNLHINQAPLAAQSTISLCMRGTSSSTVRADTAINTDFDSGSANVAFFGYRSANSVQRYGAGTWFDNATGVWRMGLANFTDTFALQLNKPDTTAVIQSNLALQYLTQTKTASATLNAAQSGIVTFTGAGPWTCTLPTLTAALKGIEYEIINASAASLTLIGNGTQLFNNKAALTSLTLGVNSGIHIVAISDAAGLYWGVVGIGGTYSAGTITGL